MTQKTLSKVFGLVFIFTCCHLLIFVKPLTASAEKQENIKFEYLYINKKIIPDTEKKITIARELLPGGKVYIAGKVAGNVKVSAVEISIDSKSTWQKIKVSQNNTFRYSFKAQPGTTYGLYIRITDVNGDTNNVDNTFKGIAISDRSVYNTVRDILDGMMEAYQGKAIGNFMSYVNESFTGDKDIYDRSIRNDFSTLHDVSIRYNLNNVTPDYKDKIFVSLNFTRSYTDIKTGQRHNDQGATSMVFRFDNGKLSLYSVQGKPLFGFSK